MQGTVAHDSEVLEELNAGFMRAVQGSDVSWFEQNLAEDFLNTGPDGSLADRAGFLAHIARPAGISNLEASDVRIRVLGEVAIIHGRTTYTKAGGAPGTGRYTDVWARRGRRWLCVAAQVMRG
jgi:ketosteroid isomerase-like protein